MAFNMIDEKYIFIPNIELDIDKLKTIVFKNLNTFEKNLATHQRYVEKESYLKQLKEKYPFLSGLYNIYPTPPGHVVPIHICPNRGCALNIPIQYTEDSYTVFYEPIEELKMKYSVPRIYHIIESEMNEVYRYTLDRPTIMNTLLPHGVFGGPKMTRIIMSWSIDISYDEIKKTNFYIKGFNSNE
jgi:hypothetical protein